MKKLKIKKKPGYHLFSIYKTSDILTNSLIPYIYLRNTLLFLRNEIFIISQKLTKGKASNHILGLMLISSPLILVLFQ